MAHIRSTIFLPADVSSDPSVLVSSFLSGSSGAVTRYISGTAILTGNGAHADYTFHADLLEDVDTPDQLPGLHWDGSKFVMAYTPISVGGTVFNSVAIGGGGSSTLVTNAMLIFGAFSGGPGGGPQVGLPSASPVTGSESFSGDPATVSGPDGSNNYKLWVVEYDMEVSEGGGGDDHGDDGGDDGGGGNQVVVSGDDTEIPFISGRVDVSAVLSADTEPGRVTFFYEDNGFTAPQTPEAWLDLTGGGLGTPTRVIRRVFLNNGAGHPFTYNSAAVAEVSATLDDGLTTPPTLTPNGEGVYEASLAHFSYDGHAFSDAVVFLDISQDSALAITSAEGQRIRDRRALGSFRGRGGVRSRDGLLPAFTSESDTLLFIIRSLAGLLDGHAILLTSDSQSLAQRLNVSDRLGAALRKFNVAVRVGGQNSVGALAVAEQHSLIVDCFRVLALTVDAGAPGHDFSTRVERLQHSRDSGVLVRGVSQHTPLTPAVFLRTALGIFCDVVDLLASLGV